MHITKQMIMQLLDDKVKQDSNGCQKIKTQNVILNWKKGVCKCKISATLKMREHNE